MFFHWVSGPLETICVRTPLYLLLLLGEIFFAQMNQPEFCGEVPVHDEAHLHLIDGIALKAQMGITPRAVTLDNSEIFVPDVKAADIADLAVDDGKLSVVAIIQANDKGGARNAAV